MSTLELLSLEPRREETGKGAGEEADGEDGLTLAWEESDSLCTICLYKMGP